MRNQTNARDNVVNMRNGILLILQEGIKQGNEGSFDYFKRAIGRIHLMDNYSMTMVNRDIEIEGIIYRKEHKVMQVLEGTKVIFTIYKDRSVKDGKTQIYWDSYDLMTKKQIDAWWNEVETVTEELTAIKKEYSTDF